MPANVFRFFHDQLPDDAWRDFYNAVESAVRIRLPIMAYQKVLSKEPKDYSRVIYYVYNDHPEFFYFNCYGCEYIIGETSVMVLFSYPEPEAESDRKIRALNQAIDRILAEQFPDGFEKASELRREKKIFDWLTDNVTYDHQSLKAYGNRMDILGDAWTAYGALVLKTSVCQGIACAFKMLCDRMGIPSITVSGMAGGPHAWNIVRIEGKFYQVDCTWTLKNSIDLSVPFKRYQYLNITDEIMGQNHKPFDSFLPRCISLHANPYNKKGLCCNSPAELYDLARQHILNGEKRFAFLCLAGYPAPEEIQALANRLHAATGIATIIYPDNNKYYIGFDTQRGN